MTNRSADFWFQKKDYEIEMHFTDLGFDGVWSNLSKLLILVEKKKNNFLSGIQMDFGWLVSSQNYVCPICGRKKTNLCQIKNNFLYGTLHLDHDHMTDYLKGYLQKLGLSEPIHNFLEKNYSYEPTFICQTCNWIDSVFKKVNPEVSEYFSMSPEQKRQVIRKVRPSGHLIDFSLGRKFYGIWLERFEEQRKALEIRLQDFMGLEYNTNAHNPKVWMKLQGVYRRVEPFERYCKNNLSIFKEKRDFKYFLQRSGSLVFSKTDANTS